MIAPFLLVLCFFAQETGPPVIQRGPKPPRKADETKPPVFVGPNIPAAADNTNANTSANDNALLFPGWPPLLVRAYNEAYSFSNTLPNFVCDELVDRFQSKSIPPKWKREDKVFVEVMYVDGKEDYRNFKINGKPLKSGTPEDSGTWSEGDWSTTLLEVLGTGAGLIVKPRPPGKTKDVIAGIPVEVFDIEVIKDRSRWSILHDTSIKPAYKGSLWIDPVTARVLRIEKQAVKLPLTYSLDAIEMVVEYGWVAIGEEKYLMPVESSSLACRRYTTNCTKNDIKFTNYRKFSSESTITTTESEISFGDPPPVKPAAKPSKKN